MSVVGCIRKSRGIKPMALRTRCSRMGPMHRMAWNTCLARSQSIRRLGPKLKTRGRIRRVRRRSHRFSVLKELVAEFYLAYFQTAPYELCDCPRLLRRPKFLRPQHSYKYFPKVCYAFDNELVSSHSTPSSIVSVWLHHVYAC